MGINNILAVLFFCGFVGYILYLRWAISVWKKYTDSYRQEWKKCRGKYLNLIHEFEVYKSKNNKGDGHG
jgi:hypothetical protein